MEYTNERPSHHLVFDTDSKEATRLARRKKQEARYHGTPPAATPSLSIAKQTNVFYISPIPTPLSLTLKQSIHPPSYKSAPLFQYHTIIPSPRTNQRARLNSRPNDRSRYNTPHYILPRSHPQKKKRKKNPTTKPPRTPALPCNPTQQTSSYPLTQQTSPSPKTSPIPQKSQPCFVTHPHPPLQPASQRSSSERLDTYPRMETN
jgi:hypothetical protein